MPDKLLGDFAQRIEIVGRVTELTVGIQSRCEPCRQIRESHRRKQDSCSVRRIAVGILPAPSRYQNRLIGVALSIKQPHDDVGTVELCIDAEVTLTPRSTTQSVCVFGVLVILVFAPVPRLFPIVRILVVPGKHVADHFGILALFGNAA